MYLEEDFEKKWMCYSETKQKWQDLFVATYSFEHILAFPVAFVCLEQLKPLVTKLQKQNQDTYVAHSVTDLVMSEALLRKY